MVIRNRKSVSEALRGTTNMYFLAVEFASSQVNEQPVLAHPLNRQRTFQDLVENLLSLSSIDLANPRGR